MIQERSEARDDVFAGRHVFRESHPSSWPLGEVCFEGQPITRAGGLIAIFEHNPLNPLTVHAVNTCPFDENARLIFARSLTRRLSAAGWTSPRIQYNLFFPRALAQLRPLEAGLGWLPLGAQYVAFARKA